MIFFLILIIIIIMMINAMYPELNHTKKKIIINWHYKTWFEYQIEWYLRLLEQQQQQKSNTYNNTPALFLFSNYMHSKKKNSSQPNKHATKPWWWKFKTNNYVIVCNFLAYGKLNPNFFFVIVLTEKIFFLVDFDYSFHISSFVFMIYLCACVVNEIIIEFHQSKYDVDDDDDGTHTFTWIISIFFPLSSSSSSSSYYRCY